MNDLQRAQRIYDAKLPADYWDRDNGELDEACDETIDVINKIRRRDREAIVELARKVDELDEILGVVK